MEPVLSLQGGAVSKVNQHIDDTDKTDESGFNMR
jgi:hypothetical protein